MSHSNAWATRCLLCKSGPFTRSELPNDALAISRPTSRSSDAITEEIVKPQHEPVADPGDADPTNTRIFIKSLSPNLLTYEEVYKTFRYFGKIKMIALQTKRHNVLVEFETHEAALAAKKDSKTTHELSGRTYTIRIHWGKKIERTPPVKNPIPTTAEQIQFCKEVDAEVRRQRSLHLPVAFHAALGIVFAPSAAVLSSLEDCRKKFEQRGEDAYMPPGIVAPSLSTSSLFNVMDIDTANVGLMPLRTDDWFNGCPPSTSPFSRVSKPTTPTKTLSIVFKEGTQAQLSESGAWSNFNHFDVPSLALPQSDSSVPSSESSPSKNEWELSIVDAKFGTPKMSPNKEAAEYVPSYVSSPPTSPSSSFADLLYGFNEWAGEKKLVEQWGHRVNPSAVAALGVSELPVF